MYKMTMKPVSGLIFLTVLLLVSAIAARTQASETILRAELYEWGIDISYSNPQAGPATLFVTNVGTRPHGFALTGPDTDLRFPRQLEPGETGSLWVELQAGLYLLYNPGAQAAERGMSLEFSVGDGQAPSDGQGSPTATPRQGQLQQATGTPTPADQQDQTATSTPASGDQQGQAATPTPADQQGDNGQQLVQQGEQIFSNNCASCHGQNGQGQVGPALVDNPFVTSEDPMPVIDTVLHGSGQMPAFEDQLTDEEIAAVVSFIRNAWGNQSSTVSVEQVSGDQAQPQGQQATPTPTAQATLEITARDRSYSKETLSVPAGAQVTLKFTNQDSFPHNLAIYEDASARRAIFIGRIFSGPDQTVSYEFTAPADPGRYFFRCDVHPFMNGVFVVE